MLETLWHGKTQVIENPGEINIVGHRVVHGGEEYRQSTFVTPEVKDAIAHLSLFAPRPPTFPSKSRRPNKDMVEFFPGVSLSYYAMNESTTESELCAFWSYPVSVVMAFRAW